MKAIVIILLVIGAVLTFLSKNLASFFLKEKREPTDKDTVVIKLSGFAIVLVAIIITFFI